MKIGIDARIYSTKFTGVGRYVAELIKNLLEVDKKNEYVVFMNKEGYEQFEPKSKRVTKVLVNARHYSFAEQLKYWWILRRYRVDLMHFTHFNAPILYRRPSVVTIHDLTLSFFPGKKMNSAFYRFAYNRVLTSAAKNAQKVIAVSGNTKKDLFEIAGTDLDKIDVIYEGVDGGFTPRKDNELIDRTLKRYGISRDFVLYTGVWRSHKNLVNLVRAFKLLREDEAFEAQLVITGEEDPYYPEIKRSVQELGLEHDVVYTGLVPEDELIALYQAAKIYAFPSLYEGFGLPPLEAMRCGTPVAASKSSCIPEICGEENVVFFDPYDPEDMANAIHKVWTNPELQKDLRDKGLKHSLKFSWEDMAEKTLAIYEEAYELSKQK